MAKSNINRYIEKSVLYSQFLEVAVPADLNMIVVIPCYNESDLLCTLNSLYNCEPACSSVEVLVVINDGENRMPQVVIQNEKTYDEMQIWAKKHNSKKLSFYPIRLSGMRHKFAGVGLARKTGMDEAVRRFEKIDNKKGIIVCLDADSLVQTNYLRTVEEHFESNPKSNACAIHYEHPIRGSFNDSIYNSIVQYELHLRYFVDQQKKLNLPFAYQTVGSSMAVRLEAYCSVGGMNRRKAGEDFYFYHKFVKLGRVTELFETMVIPSPRISDRVPFGTGKAVGDMMDKPVFLTYHPESFKVLGDFLIRIKPAYQAKTMIDLTGLQTELISFFTSVDLSVKWLELIKNTSDWKSFYKRFFHWFDAFLLMKYLHYMRDLIYPNLPIEKAVRMTYPDLKNCSLEDQLIKLRSYR